MLVKVRVPRVLRNAVIVFRINESELPFGKRNPEIQFIRWGCSLIGSLHGLEMVRTLGYVHNPILHALVTNQQFLVSSDSISPCAPSHSAYHF